MTKKYTYIGTQQMAFTLNDNSEYLLQPNETVDLPSENNHIQCLMAMNLLKEQEIKEVKTIKTEK